jgi:hypothetical protein
MTNGLGSPVRERENAQQFPTARSARNFHSKTALTFAMLFRR